MFIKRASCDTKINVQCMKKAPTSIKKVWELSEISSTATFAIIKSQHKLLEKPHKPLSSSHANKYNQL